MEIHIQCMYKILMFDKTFGHIAQLVSAIRS